MTRGLDVAKELGLKIYPHNFGTESLGNLAGVYPPLVEVAELAIHLSLYDGTVLAGGGVRTMAQAKANVANGTGILNSRHLVQLDGYGHAVDLVALTMGKVEWKNKRAFEAMAEAVGLASAILNVPIRQGCDWNMNGVFGESREWDWPHFEDPLPYNMAKAKALLEKRRKSLGL